MAPHSGLGRYTPQGVERNGRYGRSRIAPHREQNWWRYTPQEVRKRKESAIGGCKSQLHTLPLGGGKW